MRLSGRWCLAGRYLISQILLISSPLSHSFRPLSATSSISRSGALFSTRNNLEKLTVVQLKDKLRSQGLKVSGRKSELIDRLVDDAQTYPTMVRKTSAKRAAKTEDQLAEDVEQEVPSKPKRARKTKKGDDSKEESEKKKSPTKKKAADHQRITEIDEIPKLWNSDMAQENGSYS